MKSRLGDSSFVNAQNFDIITLQEVCNDIRDKVNVDLSHAEYVCAEMPFKVALRCACSILNVMNY